MPPLARLGGLAFVSVRKRVNARARRGIYLLGSSWLGDLLIRRVCQVWSTWAAGRALAPQLRQVWSIGAAGVVGAWGKGPVLFHQGGPGKKEKG